MAVVEKQLPGSATTLLSTGLNSLANNGLASAAFDNSIGAAGDGSSLARIEALATYGTAPTANTALSIWFCKSADGTTYETGYDASVTPNRSPDLVLPLSAVTTAQKVSRDAQLPFGKLYVVIKNDGTGQAMASSGNTLKILPCQYEGV